MRLDGIDTMRVVAIFAVILIHFPLIELFPQASSPLRHVFQVVHDSCRFAVPFFFLAAGYFTGRRVARGDWTFGLLWNRVTYIMGLYLFWSLAYVLAWHDWRLRLRSQSVSQVLMSSLIAVANESVHDPLRALLNGPTVHLWFLPALACGLIMVALLERAGKTGAIVPVGVLLYAIAIAFGPYRRLLGIDAFPLGLRNGPFLSTLYVGLGWMWGKRPNWQPRISTALLLIVVGWSFHLIEIALLARWNGRSHSEFEASTPVFGVGVFLLAIAHPRLDAQTGISRLGRYTLGVYVLHLIVGKTLMPLFLRMPPPSGIAHTPATYVLTVAIVMLIARVKYLRSLVT
jgi:surface polysaccharide O-acyltransferase-like enzyme